MENDYKFSYFFVGLGFGAAVAMLFAPKSGADTRDMIRSKADEGMDYLKSHGTALRDFANESLEKGRTAVIKQRDDLTAALDAGKRAYREAASVSK